MSLPATDTKPGKSPRTRWFVAIALLAALDVSGLVWAFVERVRDAADRVH
jgi:hypothetical protein